MFSRGGFHVAINPLLIQSNKDIYIYFRVQLRGLAARRIDYLKVLCAVVKYLLSATWLCMYYQIFTKDGNLISYVSFTLFSDGGRQLMSYDPISFPALSWR